MRVNQVRVSFRNYRGSPRAAQNVAAMAMENLARMAAQPGIGRNNPATLHAHHAGQVGIPPGGASDGALAHAIARQLWQSLQDRKR